MIWSTDSTTHAVRNPRSPCRTNRRSRGSISELWPVVAARASGGLTGRPITAFPIRFRLIKSARGRSSRLGGRAAPSRLAQAGQSVDAHAPDRRPATRLAQAVAELGRVGKALHTSKRFAVCTSHGFPASPFTTDDVGPAANRPLHYRIACRHDRITSHHPDLH